MALSIKSAEAERLARELAAETHETVAQTVTIALRERLERVRSQHAAYDRRLQRLIDEYQELPEADTRSTDEIIGYDEHGLPT